MSSDLINIKEKYGERMMHLCRSLFPTILEIDGKLFELLSDNFAYSKFLYDDIVNNMLVGRFRDYIYGLFNPDDDLLVDTMKSPFELLSEVGYDLYECKTEEDIQQFRKYYLSRESLCTFKGNRLDTCYVFFAVKKNVEDINRSDFINPLRQDVYGTSVISIQFTKGNVNILSIKNRYNHTVSNPDATFSNNLENIVPGLTRSFEREYGFQINQNLFGEFEIPGYVRIKNGKFHKYNYEINNIYYCPGNIIINNFEIVDDYKEREKYIIADYFIIDLVNKRISVYDESLSDSFISSLGNIKKIIVNPDTSTKERELKIFFEDNSFAIMRIDKYNRIVFYSNENIIDIGDNFLSYNICLRDLNIPNVVRIGSNFLYNNMLLSKIELPKLLEVKNNFLKHNKLINSVDFSSLIRVGDCFLEYNENIRYLNMPYLELVGNKFLSENKILEKINMPNLVYVADYFLYSNKGLSELRLSKLVRVGSGFITANNSINYLDLNSLQEVRDNFLWFNKQLTSINLPNLECVGKNFLYANGIINYVNMPKLKVIGDSFLYSNHSLEKLELLELISIHNCFLYNNNRLTVLNVPRLRYIGNDFLRSNSVVEYFDCSSLEDVGRYFLCDNMKMRKRVLELLY